MAIFTPRSLLRPPDLSLLCLLVTRHTGTHRPPNRPVTSGGASVIPTYTMHVDANATSSKGIDESSGGMSNRRPLVVAFDAAVALEGTSSCLSPCLMS